MRTLVILSILATVAAAGHYPNRYLKSKRGLLYGYEGGEGEGEGGGGGGGYGYGASPASESGLTLSSAPANEGREAIVEVPAPDLSATVTASYRAEDGPHLTDGISGRLPGSAAAFRACAHNNDATSTCGGGRIAPAAPPYLISVHQEVVRKFAVPVSRPYPVHTPVNVYVRIERPVPVRVDKPYAVRVNVPHPVAVDRPYPVPVDRPYSVPVPRAVPVPVPQPYPVPVFSPAVAHPTVAAAQVVAYNAPGVPVPISIRSVGGSDLNGAPSEAVPIFASGQVAFPQNYAQTYTGFPHRH